MSEEGAVEDHNPVAHDSDRNTFGTIDVQWVHGKRQIVHTEVHNYNPDPHYRTTGQFLGAAPGP